MEESLISSVEEVKMKFVFASHNPGKAQELQAQLMGTDVHLIPQQALGVHEIEETGLTFVENALLKARHACRETGLPALADDSGLVVPVLQGAPGIYSSRYAGKDAKAADNIKKLLADLQQEPIERRHAYFHCTLVLMRHAQDPAPLICQGEWLGSILFEPRGEQGFGYDPIFGVAPEMSAAELSLAAKNKQSHRGQALRLLLKAIKLSLL